MHRLGDISTVQIVMVRSTGPIVLLNLRQEGQQDLRLDLQLVDKAFYLLWQTTSWQSASEQFLDGTSAKLGYSLHNSAIHVGTHLKIQDRRQITLQKLNTSQTRKLCYRKDDRAMRPIYSGSNESLRSMAIRNYPRWRPAANLDLM